MHALTRIRLLNIIIYTYNCVYYFFRQNVFIIKTNDITTTQAILKSNPVNAHLVNENIVSITDNAGKYHQVYLWYINIFYKMLNL